MANVRLSTKKLVGSIMPDAYVDSVKLETVGGSPVDLLKQNDRIAPHVQTGHGIDEVQKGKPKSLRISVGVLLKDLLQKNSTTSWFLKNNFINYLSYVVVVSTSQTLTEVLLNLDDNGERQSFLGGLFSGIFLGNFWQDGFRNRLKEALLIPAGANLNLDSLIDTEIQTKLGRVHVPEMSGNADEKPLTEIDSRGRQTYNFFFQEDFDYPAVRPEHLTVFAYTIFDAEAYFRSLNVEGSLKLRLQELADKMIGSLRVSTVINNSKVAGDSVVLRFVESDEIYTGPFHTMPNGTLMEGSTHDPNNEGILYSEIVPNNSIQDFRNFEDFKPRVVDLSPIRGNILPSANRAFRDQVQSSLDVVQSVNCFSDIWLSRGMSGECEFAFTMNYEKICKDNAKYGKILENRPELLQTHFKIQSFKIHRRRVTEIKNPLGRNSSLPSLGAEGSKELILFEAGDYNKAIGAKSSSEILLDLPDAIIDTEQRANGEIRAIQNSNNIRELNLGDVGQRDQDIRTYSVSDGSIAEYSQGQYQYGIEIKIRDKTSQFIATKLNNLLAARNRMLEYLQWADQPVRRNRRAAVGREDPHINYPAYETPHATATLEMQGNYDAAANRFTQNFIEEVAQKWPFPGQAPWLAAALSLSAALRILIPPSSISRDLNPTWFSRICSPSSGTPDGIRSVLLLVEEVSFNLAKLIGSEISQKGSAAGSVPRTRGGTGGSKLQSGAPQKDVYTVTHWFDNDIFDASYPKDTGYYYLQNGELTIQSQKARAQESSGLQMLSVSELTKRIDDDVEKFIKQQDVTVSPLTLEPLYPLTQKLNITAAERFKFITPSFVSLKGAGGLLLNLQAEKLPQPDIEFDYSPFTAVATQIANLKSPAGQPYVNIARSGKDSDSIRDNLVEILADKSCTVEAPTDRLRGSRAISNFLGGIPRVIIPVRGNSSLSMADLFGQDNPVTIDIRTTNVPENRPTAEIIGIHTTEDVDLFNPGPSFMRLLMNFAFDDDSLQRGNRFLFERDDSDLGITSETFDVRNLDLQSQDSYFSLPRLPISIKSLFLSSIPGMQELNFVFPEDEDVFQDPTKAMAFYFNFFSTMRLEVLDTFLRTNQQTPVEESTFGADFPGSQARMMATPKLSLKDTRWIPLSQGVLDAIGTRELLVRMRPYQSSEFKISPLPGLSLDKFNAYFVVKNFARGGMRWPAPTRLTEAPTPNIPIRDQGPPPDPIVNLQRPRSETQGPGVRVRTRILNAPTKHRKIFQENTRHQIREQWQHTPLPHLRPHWQHRRRYDLDQRGKPPGIIGTIRQVYAAAELLLWGPPQ